MSEPADNKVNTQTQTKRYKVLTEDTATRERQLSGLFNIVSSNLLVATKLLNINMEEINELEKFSREAKLMANELLLDRDGVSKDGLIERVIFLKQRMLELVTDLSMDLTRLNSKIDKEDLVVIRRLLREAQRGLSTI